MIGVCKDCREVKKLTKHSKTGSHRPPFIWICRTCHDKRHNMPEPSPKQNKKIQSGTKYGKHKKK